MGSPFRSALFPFILMLVVLIAASKCTADVECLPGQRSSLLKLKQGFSFFPSSHIADQLPSWQPSTDCCNWEGVTCDSQSGLVIGLDLSNRKNISGEIESSLFNLTSLQALNLAFTNFSGIPIPSGFEKLPYLTSLNLSNVGFVGQVPLGISHSSRLVSLDLSTCDPFDLGCSPQLHLPNLQTLVKNLSNLEKLFLDGVTIAAGGANWSEVLSMSVPLLRVLSLRACNLSGSIVSLSRLRSLSVIRLDYNPLNSEISEQLCNLSSLRELSLFDCNLKGLFPQCIFHLRNLKVLDIGSYSYNNVSGSLVDFSEDSEIEILVLFGTYFSGNLPESLGNLRSLRTLDLRSCQFSGALPSSIGSLSQLTDLELSSNSFTGPIPMSILALPALVHLDLSYNQLSDQLPEFSHSDSLLQYVDLSNNQLQGQIPMSLFNLSELQTLRLGSNNFSGEVELVDLFAGLTSLSVLYLSNNRLSVQVDDSNSSILFPKLTYLFLASCNLTKLPFFLRYQDDLYSLDLSNNRIGGYIPKWIWSFGSLGQLNLSCNLFTGLVEGSLSNANLRSLDLHSNMLQGPIPLIGLAYSVLLDYSNNNFSSIIPSNISYYLKDIAYFSLANNSLNGEIPLSICSLRYLEVLDFSDNYFSGSITPCLLGSLTRLGVLNLRRNQLNGTIPQNISKDCGLRTIDLNNNHLGGQVPRSLTNCNKLEVLDLGNNCLVDTFPSWLEIISALRVLVLRSSRFFGPIRPSPGSHGIEHTFPMLQIFDLSSNFFNDSIPVDYFKNLKAMMANSITNTSILGFEPLVLGRQFYQDTVVVTDKGQIIELVKILEAYVCIDFSNNNFEGDIPEAIGNLRSLYTLNLSHNALTGHIPSSMGSLKQLGVIGFLQ